MLEAAKRLNIYDELSHAEVTDWLRKDPTSYDLIMACDTLIYFGDLKQVIEPALEHLNENGIIAFSVEQSDQPGYHLTSSGRYAHHVDHVEQIAHQLNLNVHHSSAFLRMEYGDEVMGLYVCMTRK